MGVNYNSTTVLPLTDLTTFGTFTGTTITDNVVLKVALQELETALEAAAGIDTFLELTDTPGAFVADNFVAVNAGGTALEFRTGATLKADLSVDDLITLSGVADGATDLGTFTGAIITDASTIKTALQELEVDLEAVQTLSGVAAAATDLGTFTGTIITDNSTVKTAIQELETDAVALQTASGIAAAAVDFGTFTGSTITDNVTAKVAMQELETALEANTTIYGGSGTLSGNTVVTMATNTLTFDGTAGDVLISNGSMTVGVNMTVTGDLTVNGTTTTVNSTTVEVADKNMELGSVTTPTDVTADGGGITLKGSTDKTINWVNATDMWTFNQGINNSSGGYVANITTSAAGAYTVLATDHTILKTGITGGGDTVTLPSGVPAGQQFMIKDTSGTATTNNITIATAGAETIDGQATISIVVDYGGFGVTFDGTNYAITQA